MRRTSPVTLVALAALGAAGIGAYRHVSSADDTPRPPLPRGSNAVPPSPVAPSAEQNTAARSAAAQANVDTALSAPLPRAAALGAPASAATSPNPISAAEPGQRVESAATPPTPRPVRGWRLAGRSSLHSKQPQRLPLAFLEADTQAEGTPTVRQVELTPEQAAAVEKIREEFIEAVGGEGQDPADAGYAERWRRFLPDADQKLRLLIGWQAFRQYQMAMPWPGEPAVGP